jgi:hypothetical protein
MSAHNRQQSGLRSLRTEGKLLINARPDNVRVDDEAVGHVVQGQKDGIGQEELETISMRSIEDEMRILTISGISIRRIAPVVVSTETLVLREDSKQIKKG